MPEFFIGHLPDVMFHGSQTPEALDGPCRAANGERWWSQSSWRDHDRYMDGGDYETIPYANIVYENLGLRARPRGGNVPEWARHIRSVGQLGEEFGILFVTDEPARAEALYGPVVEIDMTRPEILDVVVDPNARTHRGFILLMRAGAPLPIMKREPAPAL